VARGEVAEEDGALVGEGGDGWRRRRRPRRHPLSSLFGGFGARTAHGSPVFKWQCATGFFL
jgi:hypothetical protein